MYTEENWNDLNRQFRNRVAAWLAPELLLLAGIVLSWQWRNEWVTGALTSALAAVAVFSLQMHILPVRRYRAFVWHAVYGRTTQSEAAFVSLGIQPEQREGVRVYPVTMRADGAKEELNEREYFWDANLPLPEWKEGEKIAMRSWERIIVWHDKVTG